MKENVFLFFIKTLIQPLITVGHLIKKKPIKAVTVMLIKKIYFNVKENNGNYGKTKWYRSDTGA